MSLFNIQNSAYLRIIEKISAYRYIDIQLIPYKHIVGSAPSMGNACGCVGTPHTSNNGSGPEQCPTPLTQSVPNGQSRYAGTLSTDDRRASTTDTRLDTSGGTQEMRGADDEIVGIRETNNKGVNGLELVEQAKRLSNRLSTLVVPNGVPTSDTTGIPSGKEIDKALSAAFGGGESVVTMI